jgi:hypothetical protein
VVPVSRERSPTNDSPLDASIQRETVSVTNGLAGHWIKGCKGISHGLWTSSEDAGIVSLLEAFDSHHLSEQSDGLLRASVAGSKLRFDDRRYATTQTCRDLSRHSASIDIANPRHALWRTQRNE